MRWESREGNVHGVVLGIEGAVRHEPVVAHLFGPLLGEAEVAPLGERHVGDLVLPVQHEAARALEESRPVLVPATE